MSFTYSQNPPLHAVTIGAAAERVLHARRPAQVLGVTSRGIFLHMQPAELVFLSREAYRGPLTVNLPELNLPAVEPGDRAELIPGQVVFPALGAIIDYRSAIVWAAPETCAASATGVAARLTDLARRVLAEKSGAGLSNVLSAWLGLNSDAELPQEAAWLRAAYEASEEEETARALTPFFGRGSGLTPSGDDFILGLLLAAARSGRPYPASARLQELARQRTTTLSASLIECAAAGQADERLITAIDALLCEQGDLNQTAAGLISWGHSSGVDALLGMAFFLIPPSDSFLSRSRNEI